MALAPEIINLQMESIRGLYAELFMLMLQNIEDQQEREAAGRERDELGSLDLAIEDLMGSIDSRMLEFRERLALTRGERLTGAELEAEIGQFTAQLREGLEAMQQRVDARRARVRQELESIREKLKLVNRKKTGARGYLSGGPGQTMLQAQV